MSAEPVLRLEGLTKRFGSHVALGDVTFAVEPGEYVSLLGPSGSGKTTLLRSIAGFEIPDAGKIFLSGRDITRAPPHARARLGLAYVPEDRQVFPEHSVEDNLLIAAKNGPDGRRDWTLPRIWETFPLLAKLRSRDAGRLSGGEQQLLVIARALMGNPLVLLLDEPRGQFHERAVFVGAVVINDLLGVLLGVVRELVVAQLA